MCTAEAGGTGQAGKLLCNTTWDPLGQDGPGARRGQAGRAEEAWLLQMQAGTISVLRL